MSPGLAARTNGAATAGIRSSRQPIAIAATHGAQPRAGGLALSIISALAIVFHPPSIFVGRPCASADHAIDTSCQTMQ
jgi:hypothetical protein